VNNLVKLNPPITLSKECVPGVGGVEKKERGKGDDTMICVRGDQRRGSPFYLYGMTSTQSSVMSKLENLRGEGNEKCRLLASSYHCGGVARIVVDIY